MSGYLSGLMAMLAINIIVAYSVFIPGSAGLLNLGAAGFVLVAAAPVCAELPCATSPSATPSC